MLLLSVVWDLNHLPVRRGLLLRCQLQDWSPLLSQAVDDEVWVFLVLLAIVISLPKRRCLNIHMKLSCIAKFLHTLLDSIMRLHEGFLCATDEHVNIEVINLLSADGYSFTSFCSGRFPGIASVL